MGGITTGELSGYWAQGFARLSWTLSLNEVEAIRKEVERLELARLPSSALEPDGATTRALHGSHLDSKLLAAAVRDERLVAIGTGILERDVYLYQLKVNLKAARAGAAWPWHQDFMFWRDEDGMRDPLACTVAIHLDDIDDENGPLEIIARSHMRGRLRHGDSEPGGDWTSTVSAALKYRLAAAQVRAQLERDVTSRLTGRAGSIFVFHPNAVHSSRANCSGRKRRLMLVTYNAVSNAPPPRQDNRPDFIVSRDTDPIATVAPGQWTRELERRR